MLDESGVRLGAITRVSQRRFEVWRKDGETPTQIGASGIFVGAAVTLWNATHKARWPY